jgi:hypothetical protein
VSKGLKLRDEGTQRSDRPQRTFLGLPKLPARHASWVMPGLLSIVMTCIVSMISTFRSVGFSPNLFQVWLSAWGLSWVIAFPTVVLVLPLVRRATAAVVDQG